MSYAGVANNSTELNFGFVYISHPRAVTELSWRKTSKYMPKGSVSNMLVTSCRDNICRLWVETVLPDDGLINMSQFDPMAAQNPKFRTHRHKHRFMQRLKHMKYFVIMMAYAAGCNIVILASTFERVQIIPGAIHNYVRISCVDCSTDTGKIAAAYENLVCIFEPTPLIHNNSPHQLDYRWVQTGSIQTESPISSLSWNLEGTRLLTGGEVLQLWHQHLSPHMMDDDPDPGVTFEIGEEATSTSNFDSGHPAPGDEDEERGWECVWRCKTSTPVALMSFSPDGTLFATAGKHDRLVKIWFENKQLLFPSKSVDSVPMSYAGVANNSTELNFGFVYISHPRAVTELSWRKTSKYMPKGSVSNMLVTSCRDNICRLWVETVLPDDGLINMSQFDPMAAQNPKFIQVTPTNSTPTVSTFTSQL
ncbi:dmX-like protein 2 [Diaphorina citri]|uniref:DmX-like protein 2 n=1 Tax=Diaphorina citri TaxID=121845 RepID=A0A3Q0IZE9_DIACI|nr:dmX-like protein 2 [Diaphorina citri]